MQCNKKEQTILGGIASRAPLGAGLAAQVLPACSCSRCCRRYCCWFFLLAVAVVARVVGKCKGRLIGGVLVQVGLLVAGLLVVRRGWLFNVQLQPTRDLAEFERP